MSHKIKIGLLILVCFVVVVSGCTSDSNSSNSQQTPSSSGGSSSSSSGGSSSGSSSSGASVMVSYPGQWMGAISDSGGSRNIDGTGTRTISLGKITGAVVANAQKQDGGSGTLTVTIMVNGKNVASQSTNAQYGMVQVSANA